MKKLYEVIATDEGYGICLGELAVPNISLDREAVRHLAALCNAYVLHPCHLLCVAQDCVAQDLPEPESGAD